MSKRFLVILLVCILGLAGIFWLGSDNDSTNNAEPTSHTIGSNTKVTLVEYGDFECTVCGLYYPTVEEVKDKYKDEITFQFRNLPLTQIHPNAFAGARAAEAASLQSKFWEMYDKLYQNQGSWSTASNPTPFFENYANSLGLNLEQFRRDFASSEVNDKINADLEQFPKDFKAATGSFNASKDVATPTFFLNGTRLENSSLTDPATNRPLLEKFSAAIDAELAKTGQ